MDKHTLQLKVAVLAYFEKDGKILLQKRKNTGWRDGWYGFVSGYAEPGESFTSALCREVEEEAGVKIKEKDLDFGHLLQLSAKSSDTDRLFVYYRVKKWEGTPVNKEPDKCEGLEWFDLKNLPDNTIPIVKFGLEKMLSGVGYSSFGWDVGQDKKV